MTCDQLNRGNYVFIFPFAPKKWSRETGSAVPSRVSPLTLHTRAETGWCLVTSSCPPSSRLPRKRCPSKMLRFLHRLSRGLGLRLRMTVRHTHTPRRTPGKLFLFTALHDSLIRVLLLLKVVRRRPKKSNPVS